jgi:predicted transcriptional regulator
MGETRTIAIEVPAAVAEDLAEIARTTEQTTADLARQALDQFLEYEAWKREAVAEATAEVDAGGPLIAHEDMERWLASWGTDDELDPPEPTIRR